MTDRPEISAALATLEAATRDVAPVDVPALVGELERLKAIAWQRLAAPAGRAQSNGRDDRLLTAKDVSGRTTLSVAWLYRHADTLPFTRRLGRKVLFSEVGLGKWFATRAA